MTIQLKDWAVPIKFEGIELSPISIVIDHVGMHGNLPGISEEASTWLWRFTICRARQRIDSAENIQKVITEVLGLMEQNRRHLLSSVPKHFDGRLRKSTLTFGSRTFK